MTTAAPAKPTTTKRPAADPAAAPPAPASDHALNARLTMLSQANDAAMAIAAGAQPTPEQLGAVGGVGWHQLSDRPSEAMAGKSKLDAEVDRAKRVLDAMRRAGTAAQFANGQHEVAAAADLVRRVRAEQEKVIAQAQRAIDEAEQTLASAEQAHNARCTAREALRQLPRDNDRSRRENILLPQHVVEQHDALVRQWGATARAREIAAARAGIKSIETMLGLNDDELRSVVAARDDLKHLYRRDHHGQQTVVLNDAAVGAWRENLLTEREQLLAALEEIGPAENKHREELDRLANHFVAQL
jgi:hypothetical protein